MSIKAIDDGCYGTCVVRCYGMGNWQGHHFTSQKIGHGQRLVRQRLIAWLLMGRSGIMHIGAYPVGFQIGPECITVIDTHHKLMPRLLHVLKDYGSLDARGVDALAIGPCHSGTMVILLLQVTQFDA